MYGVKFGEFTSSSNYIGYTCPIVEFSVENDYYIKNKKTELMELIPDDSKQEALGILEELTELIIGCAQENGATQIRIVFDDFIEEYRQAIMERPPDR